MIDLGPVQGQLAAPAQCEEFVRAGVKKGYQAEWHPSASVPFLGIEKFVRKVMHRRESRSAHRPPSLAALWQQAATQAGLTPEALRHGGRSVRGVQARDRFIRRAVLEAGYRAVTVVSFLGWHASNISRALQKDGD